MILLLIGKDTKNYKVVWLRLELNPDKPTSSTVPLDPTRGLFCGMILETKPRPMDLDIVAYRLPDGLWAFDYEPNETVEELLCNGTEKVIDSYYYFHYWKGSSCWK
jgi:hypothetical protein